MHLASEVSSTTNPGQLENTNGQNKSSNNSMGPLTAENLAERTLDGLMADHPGELVRTGSPHIVSLKVFFLLFCERVQVSKDNGQ